MKDKGALYNELIEKYKELNNIRIDCSYFFVKWKLYELLGFYDSDISIKESLKEFASEFKHKKAYHDSTSDKIDIMHKELDNNDKVLAEKITNQYCYLRDYVTESYEYRFNARNDSFSYNREYRLLLTGDDLSYVKEKISNEIKQMKISEFDANHKMKCLELVIRMFLGVSI